MIFHQHIETKSGEIWIVNASENGFFKSSSESRQAFESRFLKEIIHFTIGNEILNHEANGAPFIENRPDLHLSISHSENWFAFYVSSKNAVGIDIETKLDEVNSAQLKKAKTHFLTAAEIERFKPNQADLQIYWGIKEAVFKLIRGEVESLKNEVEIISMEGNRALVKVKNQEIELEIIRTENFVIVYTNHD